MIKDSGERTHRRYVHYERGQRFGKLTLIEREKGGQKWKAMCDCGNVVSFQVSNGQQMCRECAAKIIGAKKRIHGESPDSNKNATRLYRIWLGMKARCNNPNVEQYYNYGGRGIKVCEEWNTYTKFKEWALNNGYEDKLTIDRIDVDGNYTPENCRWVTTKENSRNRRDNHLLTYNGETKTMAEWAEITGLNYHTLKRRINNYGYTVERALTEPTEKKCKGVI